ALVLSGVLELVGTATAVGMLAATLRSGPPLDARSGLRPVLPFFAVAFASLLAALTANLIGLWLADPVVPPWLDRAVVLIALAGFLVPVAVGMSMRTFPLYFRTRLPRLALIRVGLAAWAGGLTLRLGEVDLGAPVQSVGALLFVLGLGVFARRVPRP